MDLHIEKLTDWRHLSNFEMLTMQLNTFEKYLDLAIAHHQHNLIVIHGVGTGKLKDEIHEILKTTPGSAILHQSVRSAIRIRRYGDISLNSRRLPAGPSLRLSGGGKSGQQRAMYRLSAGVIVARAHDTDSATENNRLFIESLVRSAFAEASAESKGENVG